MTFLLLLLPAICQTAIMVWFFNSTLTPKYPRFKIYLLHIFVNTLVVLLGMSMKNGALRILLNIMVIGISILLCYSDKILRKLMVYFLYFTGMSAIDFVVAMTATSMFGLSIMQSRFTFPAERFVLLVCFNLMLIAYCRLLVMIIRKSLFKMEGKAMTSFILVLVSESVMLIALGFFAFTAPSPTMTILVWVCTIISAISLPLLFSNMKQVVASTEIKMRNRYLEQQQQLQVEHYIALQAESQRTRKLHHDIANHLQTMQSLLEQGHVVEASACFQKIDEAFENTAATYYCDNPIVNVLCYNKIHYAATKGIKTDVHLSLAAKTFLQEMDLIALFSNLLDNAIEGCETTDNDRFINMADHLDEHTYTIKVTNSKQQRNDHNKGDPLKTHKADADLHGLGTQIISEIAQKHHGTARFHDLGTTFETVVFFQLQQAPAGQV